MGWPFLTVLNQYVVIHWRTTPHTPEQNGKRERFWRTLDKARHDQCNKELIERIVLHYNGMWHHRGVQITPEAARRAIPNWRSPDAVIVPEIESYLNWLSRSE
jgi:transposase InsO family protein